MKQKIIDGLVYIFMNILGIILALYFIRMFGSCLPDTEDRFFMGRGSQRQCLYMDMNSREVYER